jgi:hypothetical protein
MDGRIAKEPIRQVYKEIDRDTAIEAVGTITKPDTKPPAPVPREEFPVRAGVVQAIETEPKKRQKTTIERLTLTRPVLVEADRVWRFTSPLGEQSYVIDPKVQKDLLSGKRNIQLKSGIQMTVKIVTVEVLEGGVWVVKERRIVDIIRVHRQAKSDLFSEPKERESRAKKKRRPK